MKNLLTMAAVSAIIASCSSAPQQIGSQREHLNPAQQDGKQSLYSMFEITSRDIVLLGDDYIANGLWTEFFGTETIKNRGVSGDCVEDILTRGKEIAANHPAKMLVCAGFNDIKVLGATEDALVPAIVDMFAKFREISPETEYYYIEIFPCKGLESQEGFKVIRLGEEFQRGIASGKFSYTDGAFLNGCGYSFLSEGISEAVGIAPLNRMREYKFTAAQDNNVMIWYGSRSQQGRSAKFYYDCLSMFQSIPAKTGGVVLLGDSLVDFSDWEELLPGTGIQPRGIAGDLLEGMAARVPDIAAGKPAKLFLLGGCNNLVKWPERSAEEIWPAYENLLVAIRRAMPDVKLYVYSVLPLHPKDIEEFPGFNKRASALNELIMKASNRFRFEYIDLYSQLDDEKGDLRYFYTTDGCHLRGSAYKKWAKTITDRL